MKRGFVLIAAAVALFVSLSASAQGPVRGPQGNDFAKQWQERIQSEKIAFLTNEMQLTPKEAQVFWPVYNEAQKEQEAIISETLKAYGALDKAVREGKSGKEIEALLKDYAKALDKDTTSSKYVEKYLKILPSEKVAKLFIGEEKFRQSQILRLRQPQMQGMGQGPWNTPKKEPSENKR